MNPISTESSKTLYRLVIEQLYTNLEDLVHFLEADGPELKELTASSLVQKSLMIISKQEFQNALASVKIMTKVSSFFASLSEENPHVGNLLNDTTVSFVRGLIGIFSPENCEFVANMGYFYMNALC
jgi:hypothetical protein